jgi:hypothetical protein
VYLSWTPDDVDNTFDIYIHDSITDRPVEGISYDVMLYRDGQLPSSSQRTDQRTTRQVYDFEQEGQYTHLEGRQHQRRQREDRLFDTGETLEFPVGMFLQAWQPRTGLAA